MLKRSLILTLVNVFWLTGCWNTSMSPAPVTGLPIKSEKVPAYHVVKKGEKLDEIAWKYSIDYKTLVKYNHLASPNRIYEGQKLYLNHSAPKPKTYVQAKIKENKKIQPKPKQKPDPTPIQKEDSLPSPIMSWEKPTEGKISKSFAEGGDVLNQGIDIEGTLGQPVRATQAGMVVYSGEGLRGYGKLIILKHNDVYLSAYAHNQSLLVNEGDNVDQGQVIAHMGNSDSQTVKLHFQIRKNGQPVDPMKFLPKS